MLRKTTYKQIFDIQNEVARIVGTFPHFGPMFRGIKKWETENLGTIRVLVAKQTELYEGNVCKNTEGKFEFIGPDRPKFLSAEAEIRFNEEWNAFLESNCTIVL